MEAGTVTVGLAALIALALAFDFMNGFHDAANAIANVVSTGVLKPAQAVAFAAFFNFIAIAIFHLKVASTVGKGIVDPAAVDQYVIFGALIGALSWNIITWYYGIPSSSSHALIGGLIGATVAKSGTGPLIGSGIFKTASFIILSPTIGFALGSALMILVAWVFRRSTASYVDRWFRRLQLVSAAAISLGHGSNDAQKTMGIIWLLLITAGVTAKDAAPPNWVVISCYLTIGFGTLFGGWRIVRTMGQRMTKLRPIGGFAADTAGAATLFTATALGIPVSSTHTITGSILGVGAATKPNGVRWGVFGDIAVAWVLTIPSSAFIAAVAWWVGMRVF